jgi:hypothetical protein
VEPDLASLTPVIDEEFCKTCPNWRDISNRLQVWADRLSLTIDTRYFSLWPDLRTSLLSWQSASRDDQWRIVNGVFALSSIAGTTWFVDEAKRICPNTAAEYDALFDPDTVTETEPSSENEEEFGFESNEDSKFNIEIAVEEEDPNSRWRQFGDRLSIVAKQLVIGSHDPGIVDTLDQLFTEFAVLKERHPPRSIASTELAASLGSLFEFIDSIGGRQAGALFDDTVRDEIKSIWRGMASDAQGTAVHELASDANRATLAGQDTAKRLEATLTDRLDAAAKYQELQEVDRNGASGTDRKSVRRALGEIEDRLSSCRRLEEKLEEELSTVLRPSVSTEGAGYLPESIGPSVTQASDGLVELIPYEGGADGRNDSSTLPRQVPPEISGPTLERNFPLSPFGNELQPEQAESPVVPVDALGSPNAAQLTATEPRNTVEPATSAEQIADEGLDETADPRDVASFILPTRATSSVMEGAATYTLDATFSAEAGNLCMPIWQALAIGEAALAYHAATAIRAIEPGVVLPAPALLASIALAQRLQSPSGPIAETIRDYFGEIDRNEFETGPEPWRLSNNLLLFAGCMRPLILAPDSGVSGVSQYIHLGSGLEPLFEVQSILTDYGQRLKGNRLDLATLSAVRSRTAWVAEFEKLQQKIAEWLERAPRFSARFRAATDVWRQWISDDGEIGRLMIVLQTQDAAGLAEVQGICGLFRTSTSFRALVYDTDRKRLKRNRGEDIYAGALEQLNAKSEEAVNLGQRWLSLLEARPEHGDYLNKLLGELQSRLSKISGAAFDALDLPTPWDSWGLVRSALQTVRTSFSGVQEMFAGTRVSPASEPSPNLVLGSSLLYGGSISLDADWQPECGSEVLLGVCPGNGL